jgi:uncharacterized protein
MSPIVENVLETLRSHEGELRELGVCRAGVFGSVARGEAGTDSDIDVLVQLDEEPPIVFEYARLKLYVGGPFDRATDVVNVRTLKPLLRDSILHDAVYAF